MTHPDWPCQTSPPRELWPTQGEAEVAHLSSPFLPAWRQFPLTTCLQRNALFEDF